MGLVARLFEQRGSIHDPSVSISDAADTWLSEWAGGTPTKSGEKINETTALNLSAVWAAVRVLTDTVASLPLPVYERMEPRGKKRAPSHPIYRLLHDRPNPEMSAFTFREVLQGHLATWGNAYAEIERDGRGVPKWLWPITPDRVEVKRKGGRKSYIVDVKGQKIVLGQDSVLHIPGPGFDGLKGYSPIHMARESLGLSKAAESFGSYWFGNGSRVAGVLEHPNKLGDAAQRHLRESWAKTHQGLENSHRVAILEEGMSWKQIGIPPEDAQFLETRKFQVAEVARWFKVPPHMIGDLERSTNNNIEHQSIEFVVHTARPWFVRWEQVINHDLFTEQERETHFAEFVMDGLLRGDSEARSNFYQAGINNGWFSPNDVLEMENKNPIPGGDRYFVRRDLIPLDSVDVLVESLTAPEPSAPAPEPEPDEDDERAVVPIEGARTIREQRAIDNRVSLRGRHEELFRQTAIPVVKREVDGIRAALKKAYGGRDATRLYTLIDEFYATHDEWVAERFLTTLLTYARNVAVEAARDVDGEVPNDLQDFTEGYAETMGRAWTGSSANQLRKIIEETEPEEVEAAIEQRLAEWEEKRAAKFAANEVVEAGEAVAGMVYGAFGYRLLWRTFRDSCPLCNQLSGRAVGSKEYFVRQGETVDPQDDSTPPLTTKMNIRHPPLHGGCDCAIVPGF